MSSSVSFSFPAERTIPPARPHSRRPRLVSRRCFCMSSLLSLPGPWERRTLQMFLCAEGSGVRCRLPLPRQPPRGCDRSIPRTSAAVPCAAHVLRRRGTVCVHCMSGGQWWAGAPLCCAAHLQFVLLCRGVVEKHRFSRPRRLPVSNKEMSFRVVGGGELCIDASAETMSPLGPQHGRAFFRDRLWFEVHCRNGATR